MNQHPHNPYNHHNYYPQYPSHPPPIQKKPSYWWLWLLGGIAIATLIIGVIVNEERNPSGTSSSGPAEKSKKKPTIKDTKMALYMQCLDSIRHRYKGAAKWTVPQTAEGIASVGRGNLFMMSTGASTPRGIYTIMCVWKYIGNNLVFVGSFASSKRMLKYNIRKFIKKHSIKF